MASRLIDPQTLSDGDDEFRAEHVGASEVAALFDASPYLTPFELWHRKKGNISTPDFMADGMANNERIEAGIRLEPAIIDWACARWGYVRREILSCNGEPLNHLTNGAGLGGHPDMLADCPDRGPGIVEIKTADWLVAKKWGGEPPLHYLLQAQVYAGLAGAGWCDILVLVGGNSLERFCYEFRPSLFAEIERRVTAFWQSVRANDPPLPDFGRDVRTLEEVLGEPTEEVADLRHDNRADELAREFLEAKAAAKEAETRADAARCELMLKIGDAGRAMLGLHRITCGQTKGTPDREITAADVGQVIKGRRGYRQFLVKETEN